MLKPSGTARASRWLPGRGGLPVRARAARPLGLGGYAAVAAIAGLTLLGLVLRLAVLGQSLFADELSTWWIVSSNGLGGVVSTVHTDAEITPPLFFVLSWLSTRVDLSPEWLRLPSLAAGTAAVPLTYILGLRTFGRSAGVVAAALTAVSPFMAFYSVEARGYELAIVLALGSTLALLAAVDGGRRRWWIAYAACGCGAVYSHYTTVFVLVAQLGWLLSAHPEARRPALLASAGAAVGFLPWLTGLLNDLGSPTSDIVNALDVLTLHTARVTLEHWSIGYPYVFPNTPLRELPGHAALVLLSLGLVLGVVQLVLSVRAGWNPLANRRVILVLALALAGPVGVALASIFGTNIVSVRHLAASWPALAVATAGLFVSNGRRLGWAASVLVTAALTIGAVKMLEERFQRPDYEAAAGFIDASAAPGDVVIDTATLSPAPSTGMRVALDRPHPLFDVGRPLVQYDPFKVLAGAPPTAAVTQRAVARARGRRIFVVDNEVVNARTPPAQTPLARQVTAALPRDYRLTAARTYPGILAVSVRVYEKRPPR